MDIKQREELLKAIREGRPLNVNSNGVQTPEQAQSSSSEALPVKPHRWGNS